MTARALHRFRRLQPIAWPLLALALLAAPAGATLENLGSVTAANGEGGYGSAIIDTAGSFVNFGSSNPVVGGFFSYISKIQTAPSFTYSAAVTNFSLLENFTSAIYDPGTGYSYWTSSGIPSALLRIHINAPITQSSILFQPGQNNIATAVIDTVNQFGYFGTRTTPSMVVKVDLANLTVVSSITLPAGLENLSASVIDTQNGFAYFGSSTTPGAVAKIKLANFTLAGTLPFKSGEGAVGSAIIDTSRQFAYFGTHDSPGKIIEVNLSNFTRSSAVTLNSGENDLTSAVIDPVRGFGYFGTNTAPGIVAAVILANMNENTSLTLGAGEDFLRTAVIDTANSYAYFGTYTTPGKVVKVDILAGPPVVELQPTSANVHAGETATFAVTADGRSITYQWQREGADIAGATAASYSFTASASDDGANFQCVLTNARGTALTQSAQLTILPIIRLYPNPWRSDRHTGIPITIDGLLSNSTVKIFTLAAHWVKTLPRATGSVTWDLTNDNGQRVASGYYFYLVTARSDKQTTHGKLMIIR